MCSGGDRSGDDDEPPRRPYRSARPEEGRGRRNGKHEPNFPWWPRLFGEHVPEVTRVR